MLELLGVFLLFLRNELIKLVLVVVYLFDQLLDVISIIHICVFVCLCEAKIIAEPGFRLRLG